MSNVIERLEADLRGAEFMGYGAVPVDRKRLSALLGIARAAGELPMNEPTNLSEWQQAVREFRAFKAVVEPLFAEVPK